MANEELTQRGYLATGTLKGDSFGDFELLNIGSTTISELLASGVSTICPDTIDFPFVVYKPPTNPRKAKPDRVYLSRTAKALEPVAVGENKAPTKLTSKNAILRA